MVIDTKKMKEDNNLKAFSLMARSEGIVCSFKSALAIEYLTRHRPKKDENIVIILNENGDKDISEAIIR